jgi:hypothetical protein
MQIDIYMPSRESNYMPLFPLFVLLAQLSELAGIQSIPFAVSVSTTFCAAHFYQTVSSRIHEQVSIFTG